MDSVIGIGATILITGIWAIFFYTRDPSPEKIRTLLFSIASGVVAFLSSFILITPVIILMETDTSTVSSLFSEGNVLWIILLAASEEIAKLLIIKEILFKHQSINNHMDGVVYGGMLGLGFALVENAFYALQLTSSVSLLRALLIPILHAGTGAIIGGILSERKIHDNMRHFHNLILTVGLLILMHSFYNYSIIESAHAPIYLSITFSIWILLIVSVAYFINLSRFRDIIPHSYIPDIVDEYREEGKTYAFIAFFLSIFTLLSIFPLFFFLASVCLSFIAIKNGEQRLGKRAGIFACATLAVSFITSFVNYL